MEETKMVTTTKGIIKKEGQMSKPKSSDLLMTVQKEGEETTVRIERFSPRRLDLSNACHSYKGPGLFHGVHVNRSGTKLQESGREDMELSFTAILNSSDGRPALREKRIFRFWFREMFKGESVNIAKCYFRDIITPEFFPKDYTNFIVKAIVLVRKNIGVKRLDLVMMPDPEPDSDNEIDFEDDLNVQEEQTDYLDAPKFGYHEDSSSEVEEMFDDDEPPVENFITVMTPNKYDYQYLPEVPVSNRSFITFRVKAQAEAYVALSSCYGDTERKTYEILLGGNKNLTSCIRDGGLGTPKSEVFTKDILSSEDLRAFWISWENNIVEVGHGNEPGSHRFLQWDVPFHKQHPINCLAVSTSPRSHGEWEFVEYISKRRTYEDAKRRAQLRQSVIWLSKKQKMLMVLEEAYPWSIDTGALLRKCKIRLQNMMKAVISLRDMIGKDLLLEVSKGVWLRAPSRSAEENHMTKIICDVRLLPSDKKPAIAVIVGLFCEKLAVDAMMEDKVSYVVYDGTGKTDVLTFGYLADKVAVLVKLPQVSKGRLRGAHMTEYTKRLITLFPDLQHVFMVGVGGAVPHYSNYSKHVRLGDVVVAFPHRRDRSNYVECIQLRATERRNLYRFFTTEWRAKDSMMQQAVKVLFESCVRERHYKSPWEKHMEQGLELLQREESNFYRPQPKTDKLYVLDERGEMMHVQHPKPGYSERTRGKDNFPRVHLGPIGSNRFISRNIKLRMDFANETGVIAYDNEYGPVVEAVMTSGCKSYVIIRGMSDYYDGCQKRGWQPYASVAAASFLRALISSLSV